MQTNLFNESLTELRKADKYVGQITGKRPHKNTPWRWATKGVAGVILESVFINGQRWTSEQAIQRFLIASTNAKQAQHQAITQLLTDNSALKRASDIERQAREEGI